MYKDENQGFYDEYKTKGIFQFGKNEIIKKKLPSYEVERSNQPEI